MKLGNLKVVVDQNFAFVLRPAWFGQITQMRGELASFLREEIHIWRKPIALLAVQDIRFIKHLKTLLNRLMITARERRQMLGRQELILCDEAI